MNRDAELIRQTLIDFEKQQYPDILSAISLPAATPAGGCGHNTIFSKTPRKIDSYQYLSTIRRTSAHNAYFHIPFCRSECLYCSFERIGNHSAHQIETYIEAMTTEIEGKLQYIPDFRPDIFYIGGGTPTILSPRLMERFLGMLSGRFDIGKNLEFTIETTPQAVLAPEGEQLLLMFAGHGVNRINVGVQSFSRDVAARNGRLQSGDDIVRCFAKLRRHGFQKVNLDLIYGLPGQTPEVWCEDLRQAVDLQPDSITTFSLRVRPPSRLHRMVTQGEAALPSEHSLLLMRLLAQRFLPQHGYAEDNSDYFIKSPDKRYLYQPFQPHNADRNLIGFGSSAYSLAGDRQIFNVSSTVEYLRRAKEGGAAVEYVIELDRPEMMRKRLAEGLRTVFDGRGFREEFGLPAREALGGQLASLLDLGLIHEEGYDVRLTPKGKVIHDHVAAYIKYRTSA
ncbi:coproporphyrinogen-III oxidase family protein [Geobacter sp. DSM 9736]|uniref:coproporphyrinogen-III oxidase family protein n=1 Tax=Geobacter sp. DSM 9736 TaxID=1277350 RepID=UPI000B5058EA|nr:coproporphyrinogen-III oxidase family protein [Geobacter sp. DSM 9736]SNB47721.1 coproporphyrinogen III oxidase, anaerobic [Geobacter sp. DSM 9736]